MPRLTRKTFNILIGLIVLTGVTGLALYFVPFWFSQMTHARRPVTASSLPAADEHRERTNPVLEIPELSVKELIFENIPTNSMWEYDKVLNKGLAQMAGTASLSAKAGTTVIFGHSDTQRLIKNGYDTMFATLDQMKPGDYFYVSDGYYRHDIVVDESKKISPDDTRILESNTDRKYILLTCWPLGLPMNRWVVIGHEVARS